MDAVEDVELVDEPVDEVDELVLVVEAVLLVEVVLAVDEVEVVVDEELVVVVVLVVVEVDSYIPARSITAKPLPELSVTYSL